MQTRTRLSVGVTVLTIMNLIGWVILWRPTFLGRDEYYHSTNSGSGLYGSSSLRQITDAAVFDYLHRNGRISDALVKAFIGLGVDWWKIIGPIILVALALVTWLFIRLLAKHFGIVDGLQDSMLGIVSYAVICLVPLAMVGSHADFGPTTMFFFSVEVGYILALILLMVALVLLIQVVELRRGWGAVICALIFLFPLGVLNETVSVMSMAALAVLLVIPSSRSARVALGLALGTALGGFLVFFFSPGRMQRSELILGEDPSSLLQRVTHGLAGFWDAGGVLLLFGIFILTATLVYTRRASGSQLRNAWMAPVSAGMVCSVAVVASLAAGVRLMPGVEQDSLTGVLGLIRSFGHGKLLILCTAVLAVGVVVLVVTLSGRQSPFYFTILAMVAGSLTLPLYMGLGSARPFFFAEYWLLVLALTLPMFFWKQIGLARRRALMVTVFVGVLVFAARGVVVSTVELGRVEAVWGPSQQHLMDINVQETAVIILPTPDRYSNPAWSGMLPVPGPYSEGLLRQWYGIPSLTVIEWQ